MIKGVNTSFWEDQIKHGLGNTGRLGKAAVKDTMPDFFESVNGIVKGVTNPGSGGIADLMLAFRDISTIAKHNIWDDQIKRGLKKTISDISTGNLIQFGENQEYDEEYGVDEMASFGGYSGDESIPTEESSVPEVSPASRGAVANVNIATQGGNEPDIGAIKYSTLATLSSTKDIVKSLSMVYSAQVKMVDFQRNQIQQFHSRTYAFQSKTVELLAALGQTMSGIQSRGNETVTASGSYTSSNGDTPYGDLHKEKLSMGDALRNKYEEFQNGVGGRLLAEFGQKGAMPFLSSMLLPNIIPTNIKKAMGEFNSSFASFNKRLSSTMSSFSTAKNPMLRMLGELFGDMEDPEYNVTMKDVAGSYTKGKVAWDGVSRKALVTSIPSYLSKILNVNETVYHLLKDDMRDILIAGIPRDAERSKYAKIKGVELSEGREQIVDYDNGGVLVTRKEMEDKLFNVEHVKSVEVFKNNEELSNIYAKIKTDMEKTLEEKFKNQLYDEDIIDENGEVYYNRKNQYLAKQKNLASQKETERIKLDNHIAQAMKVLQSIDFNKYAGNHRGLLAELAVKARRLEGLGDVGEAVFKLITNIVDVEGNNLRKNDVFESLQASISDLNVNKFENVDKDVISQVAVNTILTDEGYSALLTKLSIDTDVLKAFTSGKNNIYSDSIRAYAKDHGGLITPYIKELISDSQPMIDLVNGGYKPTFKKIKTKLLDWLSVNKTLTEEQVKKLLVKANFRKGRDRYVKNGEENSDFLTSMLYRGANKLDDVNTYSLSNLFETILGKGATEGANLTDIDDASLTVLNSYLKKLIGNINDLERDEYKKQLYVAELKTRRDIEENKKDSRDAERDVSNLTGAINIDIEEDDSKTTNDEMIKDMEKQGDFSLIGHSKGGLVTEAKMLKPDGYFLGGLFNKHVAKKNKRIVQDVEVPEGDTGIIGIRDGEFVLPEGVTKELGLGILNEIMMEPGKVADILNNTFGDRDEKNIEIYQAFTNMASAISDNINSKNSYEATVHMSGKRDRDDNTTVGKTVGSVKYDADFIDKPMLLEKGLFGKRLYTKTSSGVEIRKRELVNDPIFHQYVIEKLTLPQNTVDEIISDKDKLKKLIAKFIKDVPVIGLTDKKVAEYVAKNISNPDNISKFINMKIGKIDSGIATLQQKTDTVYEQFMAKYSDSAKDFFNDRSYNIISNFVDSGRIRVETLKKSKSYLSKKFGEKKYEKLYDRAVDLKKQVESGETKYANKSLTSDLVGIADEEIDKYIDVKKLHLKLWAGVKSGFITPAYLIKNKKHILETFGPKKGKSYYDGYMRVAISKEDALTLKKVLIPVGKTAVAVTAPPLFLAYKVGKYALDKVHWRFAIRKIKTGFMVEDDFNKKDVRLSLIQSFGEDGFEKLRRLAATIKIKKDRDNMWKAINKKKKINRNDKSSGLYWNKLHFFDARAARKEFKKYMKMAERGELTLSKLQNSDIKAELTDTFGGGAIGSIRLRRVYDIAAKAESRDKSKSLYEALYKLDNREIGERLTDRMRIYFKHLWKDSWDVYWLKKRISAGLLTRVNLLEPQIRDKIIGNIGYQGYVEVYKHAEHVEKNMMRHRGVGGWISTILRGLGKVAGVVTGTAGGAATLFKRINAHDKVSFEQKALRLAKLGKITGAELEDYNRKLPEGKKLYGEKNSFFTVKEWKAFKEKLDVMASKKRYWAFSLTGIRKNEQKAEEWYKKNVAGDDKNSAFFSKDGKLDIVSNDNKNTNKITDKLEEIKAVITGTSEAQVANDNKLVNDNIKREDLKEKEREKKEESAKIKAKNDIDAARNAINKSKYNDDFTDNTNGKTSIGKSKNRYGVISGSNKIKSLSNNNSTDDSGIVDNVASVAGFASQVLLYRKIKAGLGVAKTSTSARIGKMFIGFKNTLSGVVTGFKSGAGLKVALRWAGVGLALYGMYKGYKRWSLTTRLIDKLSKTKNYISNIHSYNIGALKKEYAEQPELFNMLVAAAKHPSLRPMLVDELDLQIQSLSEKRGEQAKSDGIRTALSIGMTIPGVRWFAAAGYVGFGAYEFAKIRDAETKKGIHKFIRDVKILKKKSNPYKYISIFKNIEGQYGSGYEATKIASYTSVKLDKFAGREIDADEAINMKNEFETMLMSMDKKWFTTNQRNNYMNYFAINEKQIVMFTRDFSKWSMLFEEKRKTGMKLPTFITTVLLPALFPKKDKKYFVNNIDDYKKVRSGDGVISNMVDNAKFYFGELDGEKSDSVHRKAEEGWSLYNIFIILWGKYAKTGANELGVSVKKTFTKINNLLYMRDKKGSLIDRRANTEIATRVSIASDFKNFAEADDGSLKQRKYALRLRSSYMYLIKYQISLMEEKISGLIKMKDLDGAKRGEKIVKELEDVLNGRTFTPHLAEKVVNRSDIFLNMKGLNAFAKSEQAIEMYRRGDYKKLSEISKTIMSGGGITSDALNKIALLIVKVRNYITALTSTYNSSTGKPNVYRNFIQNVINESKILLDKLENSLTDKSLTNNSVKEYIKEVSMLLKNKTSEILNKAKDIGGLDLKKFVKDVRNIDLISVKEAVSSVKELVDIKTSKYKAEIEQGIRDIDDKITYVKNKIKSMKVKSGTSEGREMISRLTAYVSELDIRKIELVKIKGLKKISDSVMNNARRIYKKLLNTSITNILKETYANVATYTKSSVKDINKFISDGLSKLKNTDNEIVELKNSKNADDKEKLVQLQDNVSVELKTKLKKFKVMVESKLLSLKKNISKLINIKEIGAENKNDILESLRSAYNMLLKLYNDIVRLTYSDKITTSEYINIVNKFRDIQLVDFDEFIKKYVEDFGKYKKADIVKNILKDNSVLTKEENKNLKYYNSAVGASEDEVRLTMMSSDLILSIRKKLVISAKKIYLYKDSYNNILTDIKNKISNSTNVADVDNNNRLLSMIQDSYGDIIDILNKVNFMDVISEVNNVYSMRNDYGREKIIKRLAATKKLDAMLQKLKLPAIFKKIDSLQDPYELLKIYQRRLIVKNKISSILSFDKIIPKKETVENVLDNKVAIEKISNSENYIKGGLTLQMRLDLIKRLKIQLSSYIRIVGDKISKNMENISNTSIKKLEKKRLYESYIEKMLEYYKMPDKSITDETINNIKKLFIRVEKDCDIYNDNVLWVDNIKNKLTDMSNSYRKLDYEETNEYDNEYEKLKKINKTTRGDHDFIDKISIDKQIDIYGAILRNMISKYSDILLNVMNKETVLVKMWDKYNTYMNIINEAKKYLDTLKNTTNIYNLRESYVEIDKFIDKYKDPSKINIKFVTNTVKDKEKKIKTDIAATDEVINAMKENVLGNNVTSKKIYRDLERAVDKYNKQHWDTNRAVVDKLSKKIMETYIDIVTNYIDRFTDELELLKLNDDNWYKVEGVKLAEKYIEKLIDYENKLVKDYNSETLFIDDAETVSIGIVEKYRREVIDVDWVDNFRKELVVEYKKTHKTWFTKGLEYIKSFIPEKKEDAKTYDFKPMLINGHVKKIKKEKKSSVSKKKVEDTKKEAVTKPKDIYDDEQFKIDTYGVANKRTDLTLAESRINIYATNINAFTTYIAKLNKDFPDKDIINVIDKWDTLIELSLKRILKVRKRISNYFRKIDKVTIANIDSLNAEIDTIMKIKLPTRAELLEDIKREHVKSHTYTTNIRDNDGKMMQYNASTTNTVFTKFDNILKKISGGNNIDSNNYSSDRDVSKNLNNKQLLTLLNKRVAVKDKNGNYVTKNIKNKKTGKVEKVNITRAADLSTKDYNKYSTQLTENFGFRQNSDGQWNQIKKHKYGLLQNELPIDGNIASFEKVNPELRKPFLEMASDYYNLTGRKIHVNSGYRDIEKQARLAFNLKPGDKLSYKDMNDYIRKYHKVPNPRAAVPGNSAHNVGYAVDANGVDLIIADKLGLFKKHGLFRPLSRLHQPSNKSYFEEWHTELAKYAKHAGDEGYGQIRHDFFTKPDNNKELALYNIFHSKHKIKPTDNDKKGTVITDRISKDIDEPIKNNGKKKLSEKKMAALEKDASKLLKKDANTYSETGEKYDPSKDNENGALVSSNKKKRNVETFQKGDASDIEISYNSHKYNNNNDKYIPNTSDDNIMLGVLNKIVKILNLIYMKNDNNNNLVVENSDAKNNNENTIEKLLKNINGTITTTNLKIIEAILHSANSRNIGRGQNNNNNGMDVSSIMYQLNNMIVNNNNEKYNIL